MHLSFYISFNSVLCIPYKYMTGTNDKGYFTFRGLYSHLTISIKCDCQKLVLCQNSYFFFYI